MSLRVSKIKGFEAYTIDTLGRVWSNKTKKYLTPVSDSDGYMQICLYKDNRAYSKKVHRFVALHFIPNPNKYPCINHKNLDIKNNTVENLEWCTYSQNAIHAIYHPKNAKYKKYMLKERLNKRKKIIAIKDGIAREYLGIDEAARILKVSSTGIHNALSGISKSSGGYIWKRP